MRKNFACLLVAVAGVLASMTRLDAQAREPARESGSVGVQDVIASHEPGVVEQGTDPAPDNQPRRSLSINSGYFKKYYTNPQIADVGIEAMQGYSFYSQKLEGLLPPNNMIRVAVRSATLFGNWHLSLAFEVAYHELGHATRVGAYGYNYKFGGSLTDATVEENGFFQHYGRLLRSGGLLVKGPASVHTYDAKFEPAERKNLAGTELARYLAKEDLVIVAAGVNNQMAFAERVADEAYEGDGHWTFALAYLRGRLWPIAYGKDAPRYDMDRVFRSYRQLGIAASRSQANTASLLALLASGSTYRYSRGLYYYLRDGSHRPIGAYELHNFRVPDTSVYLTSRGISYKVKTGYRFKDGLLLNAGLEYVAHGDHSAELMLGLVKNVESLRSAKLRGNVILGSGMDAEITASLPLNNASSVGMGLGRYSSKTLYGERNVPSLEHGPSSTMGWVKMSLNY